MNAGKGAPLSPELIAAVRQRARITDLFEAGQLRKAGRDFLATCPWHNDRHPSLTVSPERNRVHCFVCSRGADPIAWLQEREGLTFPEAIEQLARRYAIPLPAEDPAAAARQQAEQRERARLLQWRAQLEQRFHTALVHDLERNGPAARYLQERGLSPELARSWGLGVHQGRLMLPIRDSQGRCCGFSGRLIPSGHADTTVGTDAPSESPAGDAAEAAPKYKNSAADALFQRNSLLFGLDRSAAAIRRSGEAVLVEGPLDALQLHQAGIDNAVAALGTSLSPTQRQLLQRAGARRLILAFDGDGPGQKATARLLTELRPLAISGELELAVVPLAAAQDPDALLRQEGPAAFRQRLSGASHWLHWELEQLLAPALAAPEDLALLQRCDRQAAQLLALLPAGALRRRAEQRLRQALGAVPKALGEAVAAPVPELVPPLRLRAERRALRLYLCSPESRELLDQLELADPLCRQALSCLRQLQQRLAATGDPLTADDPLAAIVLALCPRLDPPLAALLEDLARCGTEVRRLLQADPVPELQAVLEALEPVGEASGWVGPGPPRLRAVESKETAAQPVIRPASPVSSSQEHPGQPAPNLRGTANDWQQNPAYPPPAGSPTDKRQEEDLE